MIRHHCKCEHALVNTWQIKQNDSTLRVQWEESARANSTINFCYILCNSLKLFYFKNWNLAFFLVTYNIILLVVKCGEIAWRGFLLQPIYCGLLTWKYSLASNTICFLIVSTKQQLVKWGVIGWIYFLAAD